MHINSRFVQFYRNSFWTGAKSTFKVCGSLETDNIESWGKIIKPSAYIKGMFAFNNFKPSWYKE